MTFCVASAAFAPDGSNTPGSSVDDAARMARDAPSTDTNSNTLPPCDMSPSTSKNVVYIRPNGGIGVSVPACTNVKSNSAARKMVVEPSTHVALEASSAAPDAHVAGRSPKPMHAKPPVVYTACVVDDEMGFQYSTSTKSA